VIGIGRSRVAAARSATSAGSPPAIARRSTAQPIRRCTSTRTPCAGIPGGAATSSHAGAAPPPPSSSGASSTAGVNRARMQRAGFPSAAGGFPFSAACGTVE
jgi:hypothetical protein